MAELDATRWKVDDWMRIRKNNRAAQNRGCLAARGIVRMYNVGLRGIIGVTVYCGRSEIWWTLKEQVSLVSESCGVIWTEQTIGRPTCP